MSRSAGGCSNSDLWLPRTYGRSGRKLTRGGIWMKWWSRSQESKCICGVLSIAKARFLKFSFSPNATRPRQCVYFAKLFRRQGFVPTVIVTDKLKSYGAALREIGFSGSHDQGPRANNRAENSHQPVRRRERKMQGSNQPNRLSASFRSMRRSTTHSMFNGT